VKILKVIILIGYFNNKTNMKYWNLIIWSIDQKYIDDLSDRLNVDYYDIELEEYAYRDLTNYLISSIFEKAISDLDISDEAKDYLYEWIYCNAYCSSIDIDDDMLGRTDFNKKDKKKMKEFLSLANS